MNRADKIQALKDTKLNPYKLNNPYDGLANSMHRWVHVANDAMLSNYTDEQRQKIAKNYYKEMIAPLYGKMGIAPMSEDLWMKQAYKEASTYKIEDAYGNSIVHSLTHGWNEGLPSLARAGQFVYNMAGHVVEDAMGLYQREKEIRSLPDDQRKALLDRPWHEQMLDLHNQIVNTKHDSNLDVLVNRGAERQTDEHEFWASAIPNYDGWLNHATSFVAEQAAQLPMYAAMGEVTGVAGAAAKGLTLTERLLATTAGKFVFGSLMAGTEGYAYGVATRPQEDKGQAWKDALGFTIFHGLFSIGGGVTSKLKDIATGVIKEAADRLESRLNLAKEGKRPATSAERYEDHKVEVGNNLVVAGVPGQQAIFLDAVKHVQDMDNRGWDKPTIKDHELRLMNADPARFGPVLSAASYVRSLLSATGKRISQIEPGSEDHEFIRSRLNQLIMDAGSHLNGNVEAVQKQTADKLAAEAGAPGTKKTLDFYKSRILSALQAKDPTAAKMVTPQELDAMAQKKMAADQVKAAAIAEKKLTDAPVKKAINAALKDKSIPALKIRSERTVDKYGQPAVRYSVNKDFRVQLDQYQRQAKIEQKTLPQFFADMSDEDFKDDLSNHFYPKALRKAGIYFEGQNTREGQQNPNFLAFMYNYIDQMPREFGKELESRLTDSMKVQTYMKGKKPTEPQLMYYAKAMYNHVDNFLGSGRWPAESNIFRSTQEDMWHSTQWQHELLEEKITQEKKNIKDMFSGDPKAKKAALIAYETLNTKRLDAYSRGPHDLKSQHAVKAADDEIADHITQTGAYERWKY